MNNHLLRLAAIGLAAGLCACGGGGGNPGTCTGSPEVCIEGGNPNFEAPTPVNGGSVAPSTPPATTQTAATTPVSTP